jgi:hypothetical protein
MLLLWGTLSEKQRQMIKDIMVQFGNENNPQDSE